MNESSLKRSAHNFLLLHLMQAHGDAIVRTCFLLCGNQEEAHHYAQIVFQSAANKYTLLLSLSRRRQRVHLLASAFRICPCKPTAPQKSSSMLAHVLALAPDERQIALLCLYHNLPPLQAASLCSMKKADAEKHLNSVKKKLSGFNRTAP